MNNLFDKGVYLKDTGQSNAYKWFSIFTTERTLKVNIGLGISIRPTFICIMQYIDDFIIA